MLTKLNFFILLMIYGRCQARLQLEQGEPCPHQLRSYCTPIYECPTLKAHFDAGLLSLITLKNCGFTITHEMICCPQDYPLAAKQQIEPVTDKPLMTESLTAAMDSIKLVTLAYLNDFLDDYVLRCTAVWISPKFLITSKICASAEVLKRPKYAVVGLKRLDDTYSEKNVLLIKKLHAYGQDIVLLELENAVEAVDSTPLCNAQETVIRYFSSAWPLMKNPEMGSCGIHQQLLTPRSSYDCPYIRHLGSSSGQRCFANLAAETLTNPYGNKCLVSTGHVLHLQRADGSICLAGLATPTAYDAENSTGVYYYTMLSTPNIAEFIKRTIAPEQHSPGLSLRMDT